MFNSIAEAAEARRTLTEFYEQEDLIWHVLNHPGESLPMDDENVKRLRAEIMAHPADDGDPAWRPHPLEERGASCPSPREWRIMTADDAELARFVEGQEVKTLVGLADDPTR